MVFVLTNYYLKILFLCNLDYSLTFIVFLWNTFPKSNFTGTGLEQLLGYIGLHSLHPIQPSLMTLDSFFPICDKATHPMGQTKGLCLLLRRKKYSAPPYESSPVLHWGQAPRIESNIALWGKMAQRSSPPCRKCLSQEKRWWGVDCLPCAIGVFPLLCWSSLAPGVMNALCSLP